MTTLNQHALDFINADIDDELHASEVEALNDLLTHSPQAKEHHDRLKQITQALDDLPCQELPASLSAAVLSKVATKNSGQSSAKDHHQANWLATLLTGQWQAGAAALAIAAIVAVGVSQFSTPTDSPLSNHVMVGTLLPESKLGRWQQLDKAKIAAPQLQASLDLAINSDALQLNVMLEGGTAERINIQIKSNDYTIQGLQGEPLTGKGQAGIQVDDQQASMANKENQLYQLVLDRKNALGADQSEGFQILVYADKQLILNKYFNTIKKN
jgi:hypothetical protein